MNYKKFIVAFLIGYFSFSQEKPNIIVILTDDQGWADVGFNGATDIPTENLDRLAREGVIFSNGYVSHPYCSPSRAGLLTGRYQSRFGHDCNMPYKAENDNTVGTPLAEKMISEALKEQGYRTSAIGKWHVGDHPDLHPPAQGFDHWFGFPGGGMNYWGYPKSDLKRIYRNGKHVPTTELSYLTDDFTNEAISIINQKDSRPFFIYLAYNAPHTPDHVTERYLENTKHIEYGGRSVYGAMVNAVDINVGRIDAALKKNNIKENTILIYLSDNGGRITYADNGPNRGHKGMLFEGGIKVPFFMVWPNKISMNSTYDNAISALDIFPTLLNAAGGNAKKEEQLDGVDLIPFLENNAKGIPHKKLFWRSSGGFEYAVRFGKHKLYKSAYKAKTLLFDLDSDPLERYDIAHKYPKILSQLEREYSQWNKKNIDPKWYDPHAENVIKEEQNFQQSRRKAIKSKS